MKIFHGKIEIAGQMGILCGELKQRGYQAAAYNSFHSYLGYEEHLINTSDEEIAEMHKQIIEEYDLFHFHYASSLLDDYADLPLIAAQGKKMIMHHWGNDVRFHDQARVHNPYVYTGDSPPNEVIRERLSKITRHIKAAIVQDREVAAYVEPYYEQVYILPIAIDLSKFTLGTAGEEGANDGLSKKRNASVADGLDGKRDASVADGLSVKRVPGVRDGLDEKRDASMADGLSVKRVPGVRDGLDEKRDASVADGLNGKRDASMADGLDRRRIASAGDEGDWKSHISSKDDVIGRLSQASGHTGDSREDDRDDERRRLLVLHAPTNPDFKGTRPIEAALEALQGEYDFEYRRIEKMNHEEAIKLYRHADLIVDQILCGSYGLLSVESMALAKPVITYIRDDLLETFPPELPIVSANPDTIKETIASLLEDASLRRELGLRGRAYVEKYHAKEVVTDQLEQIYKEL